MQRRTVRGGSQPCSYGACGGQGRAGDNCVTAPGPAARRRAAEWPRRSRRPRQAPSTKPPLLAARLSVPFFFSYDPSVLGTVARPGSVSLSNAFSPEPTSSAAGKHTHERSHSRPARAHGRRTRAARLVHERARPTASARPGAARQLSAPRFHSNPLLTTLFLHFCVKAVHIPGHPLHTFDCVLATVRRHSKNKQTKKPPALEKQQNF